MNKKIFKHARTFHKTLGYVLALQIFFWLLGGLVMSVIPLEKVHGKHIAQRTTDNPFSSKDYSLALDPIRATTDGITDIHYDFFLDTPLYRIKTTDETFYLNAITGERQSKPSIDQIIAQAKLHYLGNAQPASIISLDQGPREARNAKNLWHVSYDDSINTSLYFSQQSGKLLTVRSDLWRIFDFFWMLHIMDYQEREDFNHPLLIIFAFSSVLFCLSGITLILQRPLNKRRTQRKAQQNA